MSHVIKRWATRTAVRHEAGATAVEYALMVGLIALVILAAVIILGQNLSSIFQDFSTQV